MTKDSKNQIENPTATTARIPKTIAREIHKGHVTHIHGQVITPHSFKTIKATPNNPVREILGTVLITYFVLI